LFDFSPIKAVLWVLKPYKMAIFAFETIIFYKKSIIFAFVNEKGEAG
jgi:hypothetical protein